MNLKKFYRDLKFGVLKPKIFIILFSLFFSSLAFAATLIVTHIDHRIPAGAAGCFSSQRTNVELDNDRTEDLRDVMWSDDGTMVFSINDNMNKSDFGDLDLSMNKVRDPFELKTVKTTLGIHTCDDIDGFDVDHPDFGLNAATTEYTNFHAAQNGRIFFILSESGELHKFNLSSSFDFRTASYENEYLFSNTAINSFSFSKDGTRMFALNATLNTMTLTTFSLSSAFNTSSPTQIHSVDLSTIGIDLVDGEDSAAKDVEFNDTGSAMFISVHNQENGVKDRIHQFSLSKNYDVSTANHEGSYEILHVGRTNDEGRVEGFSFSSDGMKLFLSQSFTGDVVDNIYQFDLECPYGIVKCSSDSISSLASQLTLAKHNITLNTSTIFRRFEWVKRNRGSENLNNFNLNINSDDPILSSLTNKLEHLLANTKQISLSKNNKKDTKKTNWSYWSHADISIGDYRKTLLEKAQRFRTEGLTLGADKKYGDNKFFGLALRYSDNNNSIKGSSQKTEMESLTLNFYGVIPKDEDHYINAVLGLSALRFDQKYLDKLTGERNGKQIFTAINFRSKKNYSGLNITPSGRLTYGITYLSEYTDFISNVKNAQNVLYDNDHFETGDLAVGFLFNTDEIQYPEGTFTTNGGLEFVYDFTPVAELNYSSSGSTNVNVARLDNYSEQNIRGNIGFEFVYLSGLTVSMNYERYQSINTIRNSHTDTFLIKFSHIVDEDSEFAFNYDPSQNHQTNFDYKKAMNGYDIVFSSNYKLNSKIPDYGANIEVSSTF